MNDSTWRPEVVPPVAVSDVEEARATAGEAFYPHRLSLVGSSRQFALRMRAGRLGPVFVGDMSYAADVRIDGGELATSYQVNLPLRGSMETRQGRVSTLATPERAAVCQPVGETSLTRWDTGCRLLGVKIDKSALESTLGDLIGRAVDTPIPFDLELDLRSTAARSWVELALLLSTQLQSPGSIVYQPLVGASLAKSILAGLLSISRHPYRAVLAEPVESCRPQTVNRAIEFIHEHAGEPITTADIAKHCYSSVRALQEGFQKHVGVPPLRYLQSVRLRRAHEDLVAANPFDTTVTEIARRWGFTHLSRFATAHEATYGARPSHTLKSGA